MMKPLLDYSNYYWQTDKIRLRALTVNDAGHQFAASLDSISIEEFNIGIDVPTSIDQQTERLEKYGGCKEINGMIAFAIETLDQTYVGMATINSMNERHGTFGFSMIVDRPHRKRGYAEDVVRLILKYGFLERRFRKCCSACAGYNTASAELHRKLGFVEEGRLRKETFYNGDFHDELRFGLLLEEYLAINPQA